MRQSSFRSTLLATAVVLALAISISPAFAQGRSRPGSTTTPPASKTTPPAPTAGPQITTQTLPEAEATREYTTQVEVKGGKAPYTFEAGGTTAPAIDANGKITVAFADPGNASVTVTVTDADGKKAERTFTVKVGPKELTNEEILAQARNGVAIANLVDAELAKKASKTELAVIGEEVVRLRKEVNVLNAWFDTINRWSIYAQYGGLLVLGLAVGIYFWNRRRRQPPPPATGTLARLIAFLAVMTVVPTFAATPKVVCGDPQFNADFFQADGSDQEVVCTGVKGTRVETGDPTNVTVKDVATDSKGRLTFKITPATGATLDYLELNVDGKSVGKPIEIVSPAEFRSRDRSITSLTQVLRHKGIGGGGGSSSVEDMRWLGLFNAVCGADKARARCGREFGSPITGAELFGQLRKARNQAEEDAVMRQLSNAAEFNATDRALGDPRLKEAFAGALKAFGDGLPKQSGVTEARVRAIAQEVVSPVRETANAATVQSALTERRLGGGAQATEALGTAVLSARGAKPIIGGGGLRKQDRRSLEDSLACARYLARTGEVANGCPEPQQ